MTNDNDYFGPDTTLRTESRLSGLRPKMTPLRKFIEKLKNKGSFDTMTSLAGCSLTGFLGNILNAKPSSTYLIAVADAGISGICPPRHDTGCQREHGLPRTTSSRFGGMQKERWGSHQPQDWTLRLCCADLFVWSLPCRFALAIRPHKLYPCTLVFLMQEIVNCWIVAATSC